MTEEAIDTPEAPPEESPEVQEPTEEVTETAEEAPDPIAQALEAYDQRQRSWLGRRDKDLLSQVGSIIDERLQSLKPKEEEPDFDFENPSGQVRNIVDQALTEREMVQQRFQQDMVSKIADVMDAEPLYKDQELGNEVLAEIKKNFGNVRKDLPTDAAAELLVSNAHRAVSRRRARAKNKPLAGNTKVTQPIGGLKPSGGAKPKAVEHADVSDLTKQWAKKWGYSDEDMATLYPKK